ncbi:MAG: hypothetical protein WCJ29_01865 [bacterium]
MLIAIISQFENALQLLERLFHHQYARGGDYKFEWMSQSLRGLLMNGAEPDWIRAQYMLHRDELFHEGRRVYGATRFLPYELARFVREKRAYRLTQDELAGLSGITVPFQNVRFPHSCFAIELAEPLMDKVGNPFSTVIVTVEGSGENQSVTLTVFSDWLFQIGTRPIEQLNPNELVRSIEVSAGVMKSEPEELNEQLEFMFSKWPTLREHAADFWFAWISIVSHLSNRLAEAAPGPVFRNSLPVGPVLPPLPPYAVTQPQTPFDVKEMNLQAPPVQNQPPQPVPGATAVVTRRQGREQNPTARSGYDRTYPGQKGVPNAPKFHVNGYTTRHDLQALGVPVMGKRTKVGK